MGYKGANTPLPQIAKDLHADLLVTGSIVRTGERARISAQLVKAATGATLWADSFEGDLRDILTLQARVARSIAERIHVRLSDRERERLARARPLDPRAHDAYLRGRQAWDRHEEEGLREAIRHFERAVQIDATYAAAYAGLADAWASVAGLYEPATIAMPKARAAAIRALELDSTLAEAHSALGLVKAFYDWKWSEAETEFRQAIELRPSSDVPRRAYQYFLYANGRTDEALAQSRRGREIDPLSLNLSSQTAVALYYGRRYDEAIRHAQSELRQHPDYHIHHLVLGASLLQKKDYSRALPALREGYRLDRGPFALAVLGSGYALSGRSAEARQTIGRMSELARRGVYVQPYDWAMVHASLGEKDKALVWLDRAIAEHSEELGMIKVDPIMDPIRSDSRFISVLRRVGFAP